MKIAAAQFSPVRYSVLANIDKHLELINSAILQNVQLIVFPEMSITGYEREEAEQYVFVENDARLAVFQNMADLNGISILVGAPVKILDKLSIGAFFISPNGPPLLYTKQFLHNGEEVAFSPGSHYNPLICLGKERISIAICADICNAMHPQNAAHANTSLYLASIFYSPGGLSQAYNDLSIYAKQYQMNVLMANFCGNSYGMEAGGRSAFWDKNGNLVSKLGSNEEGLLVVEI